jgi:hypothetical protein
MPRAAAYSMRLFLRSKKMALFDAGCMARGPLDIVS